MPAAPGAEFQSRVRISVQPWMFCLRASQYPGNRSPPSVATSSGRAGTEAVLAMLAKLGEPEVNVQLSLAQITPLTPLGPLSGSQGGRIIPQHGFPHNLDRRKPLLQKLVVELLQRKSSTLLNLEVFAEFHDLQFAQR